MDPPAHRRLDRSRAVHADTYERYLRQDIEPFFGQVPLAALTPEDIGRWVKHMETTPTEKTGKPLSPKSIKNKHGFLSRRPGRRRGQEPHRGQPGRPPPPTGGHRRPRRRKGRRQRPPHAVT
ncbi:hypothetical protein [Mycobacterium kubicae]|uniref:hypothetical protein n=1 Tax=Mycobacterium kubicae TaxID=120959 RepID=UPI0030FE3B51